jgi:RNA polymerase sigma-70 factor (ECF subfamily)
MAAANAAGEARRGALTLARVSSLRARLVARDERALAEVITIATPWLLGIAQAMLSDQDEAEEVVLESFRVLWDRVGTLDEAEPGLMAWLIRITRNRAIDRLRTRRRRAQRTELAHATGQLGDHAEPAREPDEAAQPGWHVHEAVHQALRDLPGDQRATIQLAYFEGLTHSEIAERLAIPMGTVKTRLRLAYGRLRTALKPLEDWV